VTSPPGTRPPPSRGAGQLLRDRTFGLYFAGNLVSSCGNWMQNIAAAVVVYNLTGSALLVGAVNVAQYAASLLLAPYAGALGDRVDRRKLLMAGQAVSFCGAAPLAVWVAVAGVDGFPGVWPVLLSALVIGLGLAFSDPARNALVPALVRPEDLDQAIALNSVTFNVARAVGPVLAAATLALAGPAVAFGVNSLTFAAMVCVLLVIRPRQVPRSGSGKGSVREGLAYVLTDRRLLLLLLTVVGVGVAMDPVNTLTPPLAAGFGGGDALVGIFSGAFGAGAVAATVALERLRARWSQHALSWAGLAILGSGMVLVAVSPDRWSATASFTVAGAGYLLAMTTVTTRIQRRVPEDFRGRVLALWSMAFLGSRPFAALVNGALADLLGVRLAVLFGGAMGLAVAVVVFRVLRPEVPAAP